MLLVAIAVIVFFFCINKNYLSLANIQTVLLTISFDGLLTLGAALVLIGGNVDLSTGAVACFSGCLFGLACNAGIPWGIALALGILEMCIRDRDMEQRSMPLGYPGPLNRECRGPW